MEKLENYIKKQIRDHRFYRESFKSAPSISNEFYHPKTGRRLTFNQMYSYVERDEHKRTLNIIKKVKEWTEQNVKEKIVH